MGHTVIRCEAKQHDRFSKAETSCTRIAQPPKDTNTDGATLNSPPLAQRTACKPCSTHCSAASKRARLRGFSYLHQSSLWFKRPRDIPVNCVSAHVAKLAPAYRTVEHESTPRDKRCPTKAQLSHWRHCTFQRAPHCGYKRGQQNRPAGPPTMGLCWTVADAHTSFTAERHQALQSVIDAVYWISTQKPQLPAWKRRSEPAS